MPYGLQSTSLTLDAGQNLRAVQQSAPAARPWRTLDAERRLAVIEASLVGSGVRDGYPLAL